jgi:predicted  nucleic acid-binding Zn-ribbon protein
MAEATFTLRAVDATKQAFASVQNNLSSIDKTTKSVARGIKSFLGIGVVVAGLGKIASTMREVEANGKEFGLSAKEIDNISAATSKLDGFMMGLKATVALTFSSLINLFSAARTEADEINMRFAKGAPLIDASAKRLSELRRQFDDIGKSESILFAETEQRINQLTREAALSFSTDPVGSAEKREQAQRLLNENKKRGLKLEEESFELRKQFTVVTDQLCEAQSRLFAGEVSVGEAVRNKQMDSVRIMGELMAKENQSIERQIVLKAQLVGVTNEIADLQEFLNQPAMQAGEMIASGFEDAIFSGQKLSEVLKQLGLDLVRLVFQNVVTAPLAKGIGNLISGARADGGPVNSGRSYLVGERGPELFVPGSSGSIVPNDAMRSGGGGGGPSVNITYNIAAGVTRSELGPILESERKRLKAEIPDMVRRGGAYRAAFA